MSSGRDERVALRGFEASARGRLAATLAVAAALVASLAASADAGRLGHNPANDTRLLNEPIEDQRYDRATHCRNDGDQPGATALADWIANHTRGSLWGIYRCEIWGRDRASVHAEGRAIDYRLDAGIPKERRAAMHLIDLFLEDDRNGNQAALARRMGVQGLIFNCKAWFGGPAELGRYSHCYKRGKLDPRVDRTTAHKDHVHIELNWPGARMKTSFWRSRAAG